jgi:glycosyltransferase involved in cell wall biosynthesis
MHNPNSHSVGALSAFLGNKVPLILSRRVDFVPKKSWFTKWKYNHPSIKRILCVSDKINTIMRAYLNNPDKSVTVHSGVDLDKFNNDKFNNATNNKLRSEFNISSDFWIIGNSSALEAHKDYYTFIRTIGVLVSKKLPIHSFIIGTGSQEASLKAYVAALALEQHITFTGFRNDIVDILPSLDIFLMTSSEEGLGTSVLDAFLSKAVVVATRAGGIPEMVVHEQSGLLAAVGDSEALASEVERVIKSPQLKDQLILGALNKVKDFSKEATAANTLAIYREVLSEQQL